MKKGLKNGEKQVVSGALMLTASMIIVKIFGLIYKVPLSYILSDEGMGYFNTAYSVYTFFYVISSSGLPKAISIITAASDEDGADRACLTAFRGFFIIGSILSVIFILISSPTASALGSRGAYLSMLGIAPSIAFVSASGALRGYFNGKLKLFPVAVSELIAGVSKLVFGLVFATLGQRGGLEAYEIAALSIIGITLGSFFGFIYLFAVMKLNSKKARKKVFSLRSDFNILKSILKISIPLTLSSAIGSLINLLDVGLVMRALRSTGFSELQANIIYGNYTTLVVPMFNLVATLLAPVSAVLLPLLTKNASVGNTLEFKSRTKLSLDLSLFITIPISLLFFYYSEAILIFIFEDDSAKMAAPLLSTLAFSIVFMGMLLIINTAVEGTGNYRLPLLSLTLGSLAKLIISAALIPNDSFNILAAPIGTTISYLISFFISYIYLNNIKKIKVPFLKTAIISVVFSVFSLILSAAFNNKISMENWYLKQIFVFGIFGIVYFTFILAYVFIGKSRQKVYNCDKNRSCKLCIKTNLLKNNKKMRTTLENTDKNCYNKNNKFF